MERKWVSRIWDWIPDLGTGFDLSVQRMEDSTLVAGFIVLGIATSIACHFLTKNYLYASAAAAMLSSLVLLIADYFILGYLDPFVVFGFPGAVLVYFLFALVIGAPFAVVRKRRGEQVLIPRREDRQKKAK